MVLLIVSFLAGVLTSLAPCILPLLPVIVGSSILAGDNKKHDKWKPFIISASLAVSVILFTLILKVSSALIGIDPKVWLYLSGGIVILLGITMFFPLWWARVSSRIGLESGSNTLLSKAYKKSGYSGPILTGFALGPVFSSCSPIYALVLATVLPVNVALGMIYIISYALGLGTALLAIALLGRKLTSKLGWVVNPEGAFRKVLAIILVLVGLLVITGYEKKFQVWAADHIPFGIGNLEEKLVPMSNSHKPKTQTSGNVKTSFNVDPYDAPAISGIIDWINSEPLTIAKLKGKVVLIDFWTYSCINCQRTQPYLNKWYDSYQKDGFEIIGVHAPEFAFEKVPDNVRKAVKDESIKYPVALDNDFTTWRNYENQYWPAKYLIDKDGKVRYTQFGEGDYDITEKAIQTLLKETGKSVTNVVDTKTPSSPVAPGQSPETYLGYSRGERFANADEFKQDQTITYTLASQLSENSWSFGGAWNIGPMQASAKSDNVILRYKFSAKEVYLVMDGLPNIPITLSLNGKKVTAAENGGTDVNINGELFLDGARLYKLIALPNFARNQTLDIKLPAGTTVNAFTFGG